ncbi:MAG: 4-alpha-glucanotransferase [Clostridia bacterium]|nr:MAG: 4-alpha-glucanotransferase [Clostridia bacterium]
MATTPISALRRLAGLYGIQTAYRDAIGRRRQAETLSLLAALAALGAPVENLTAVPEALRERRQRYWQQGLEPATVAWQGKPAQLGLRLPAELTAARAGCSLELETGEVKNWTCTLADLPVVQAETVEGIEYSARSLALPAGLPWGYHRFTLTASGRSWHTLIISAPTRAYAPPLTDDNRAWGVFLPLYALRSGRNWGAGDFTDLEDLAGWVQGLGGILVGTLPLLAAFLEEPFDPSPYAPASRLFWNEFFLDVTQIPELERCPAARELVASPAFQEEVASLAAAPLVDYRRGLALKRLVLEHLARCLFSAPSARREALGQWVAENPAVKDYARFRAAVEKQGTTWPDWSPRMRQGALQEGDYDPESEQYHLYGQWLAAEQLQKAQRAGRPGFYLDLPLGVHPAGYDVWREQEIFARQATCGAPPDPLFAGGQDWGLPPLHPEKIRAQGYRYFIACLRHHLRYARVLRLDHVMGLHRLFWIPQGLPATAGVYVRYHAEEFYAILALESHRHRALLVGEDLGTVPGYIRRAMTRHGLYRMHVQQLELDPARPLPLPRPPARSLASLNTHDLPPFAAFWAQENAATREALAGFLRSQGWPVAATDDPEVILRAALTYLAASPAALLLVNLEDLWLETAPQNIPGTGAEQPNWRRKARYRLEEFSQIPQVREFLEEICRLRRMKAGRLKDKAERNSFTGGERGPK